MRIALSEAESEEEEERRIGIWTRREEKIGRQRKKERKTEEQKGTEFNIKREEVRGIEKTKGKDRVR